MKRVLVLVLALTGCPGSSTKPTGPSDPGIIVSDSEYERRQRLIAELQD
jgi:hypothetical protein